MSKLENAFQQKLEQLQRGEPLEACQADLPKEEARLLELAVELGRVAYPEPDRDNVAEQRARLLRLAEKEKRMSTQPTQTDKATRFVLPRWVVPAAALLAVVTCLFLCALSVVGGAGLALWQFCRSDVPPELADQTDLTPRPPVGSAHPTAEVRVTSMPQVSKPGATATLAVVQVPDAQSAMLKDAQGLVQVQEKGGSWAPVSTTGRVLHAGDRVRTGALSRASLIFYDGSLAHLGPETEVSVDELDARAGDEPRVVVLTQWIGETEHDVVPSTHGQSRYQVNTPSGSGVAKGTVFHVTVTPSQVVYLRVDEGMVAMTHLDVTVLVVAGQLTVVMVDQPPSQPAFRVTGEGQVEEIGNVWQVAGQRFETAETTVIVGNPQVGDWVLVDGHLLPDGTRVADRIVLLRRAEENRFTLRGKVEAIGDGEWTVAGQSILVNAETEIDEGIEEEDQVQVDGVIQQEGTLLAERIRLIEEGAGFPFYFVGVVQEIGDEIWIISGISITVDVSTQVDENLEEGDLVQVRGWVLDDGTRLAGSIRRLMEPEHEFEFSGHVEGVDPWVISGIAVETRIWTEIEPGIEIGDAVRVEGRILEDGTWLATEIKRLDDEEELYIEFVGTVESVEPWVIGGLEFDTDDETEIRGEIVVGMRVKVEAKILPDGTRVIREVKLAEIPEGGCMQLTSVVVRMDAGRIVLGNGATLALEDILNIQGEIQVYSVIAIQVCVGDDGTLTLLSVMVIYQIDPTIVPVPTFVPWPTPVPPQPVPPDQGDVTLCHKPGTPAEQTMTVPRSALSAHLGHGDTLGPCPAHHDDHDDDHDD